MQRVVQEEVADMDLDDLLPSQDERLRLEHKREAVTSELLKLFVVAPKQYDELVAEGALKHLSLRFAVVEESLPE